MIITTITHVCPKCSSENILELDEALELCLAERSATLVVGGIVSAKLAEKLLMSNAGSVP